VLTSTQAGNGEIVKIDIQSGAKTTIGKVRPGIDNFAIDTENRLFISHFIDGGVAEILSNGQERVLVPAGFLGPMGLAVGSDGTLYAADGMSVVVISRIPRICPRRSRRSGWYTVCDKLGWHRELISPWDTGLTGVHDRLARNAWPGLCTRRLSDRCGSGRRKSREGQL
jgi:hypothetical protein